MCCAACHPKSKAEQLRNEVQTFGECCHLPEISSLQPQKEQVSLQVLLADLSLYGHQCHLEEKFFLPFS